MIIRTNSISSTFSADGSPNEPVQYSDGTLAKVGFVLSETGSLARIGNLLESDPDFSSAMRVARSDGMLLVRASALSDSHLSEIKQNLINHLLLNDDAQPTVVNQNKHLLLKDMDELAKIHFSIEALLPLRDDPEIEQEVRLLQSSYAMKLNNN